MGTLAAATAMFAIVAAFLLLSVSAQNADPAENECTCPGNSLCYAPPDEVQQYCLPACTFTARAVVPEAGVFRRIQQWVHIAGGSLQREQVVLEKLEYLESQNRNVWTIAFSDNLDESLVLDQYRELFAKAIIEAGFTPYVPTLPFDHYKQNFWQTPGRRHSDVPPENAGFKK